MAPPRPTTPKKRKRSDLTSAPGEAGGNDSDSDYNPRKPNYKPKPKPKSSTPAARYQSIAKTSTSLRFQPSKPYSDVTTGDGEERAAEAPQLPTPPKISLFSKFGKKSKKTGNDSTPSSFQRTSVECGSHKSASSFDSPQQTPTPRSTFAFGPPASILRSPKSIPFTNLLATHQTRSGTGSLLSAVVPNYIAPSLPSINNSEFATDLLSQPSSPLNPFRILAPTKSALSKGEKQPGYSAADTPPVKPSGIKLRFNLKAKRDPAKAVTFEGTTSEVPSPDASSQKPKSSYTPPVFGSGNSSSILKKRYQSSPPECQPRSGSTPPSAQSSFLTRPTNPRESHGSFGSAASCEQTLEDILVSTLQAELGSDFGDSDIDVVLPKGVVNKNVSDDDSDCEIDADILAEMEAEEAEMNRDGEVRALQPEWQPSPDLAYNLYISDHEELTTTTQKLYWLQMQAQWAERGGIKNSFLTGLDAEVLHLEGVKLGLEQKLSFIPNFESAGDDVNGEQVALQIRQEKRSPASVQKIAPTFSTSGNGDLVGRGREKVNAKASRLNGRKPLTHSQERRRCRGGPW